MNHLKFNFSSHIWMFQKLAGSNSFEDIIPFLSQNGFAGIEDNWFIKKSSEEIDKIAKLLKQHSFRISLFVGHLVDWENPTLVLGDENINSKFLDEIEKSLEISKKVGCKHITVVAGVESKTTPKEIQKNNLITVLNKAVKILEGSDLTMVLEPLNTMNHPNQFVTLATEAFEICKEIDSKHLKILFDIYHQQVQRGDIINTLEKVWNEVGYIQIADHPGRCEPRTGEINFENIFKFISEKKYDGFIGLEHRKTTEDIETEKEILEFYKSVLNF